MVRQGWDGQKSPKSRSHSFELYEFHIKQEWMWFYSKIASMWCHAKHVPSILMPSKCQAGQKLTKQAKNWPSIVGQAKALAKLIKLDQIFLFSQSIRWGISKWHILLICLQILFKWTKKLSYESWHLHQPIASLKNMNQS